MATPSTFIKVLLAVLAGLLLLAVAGMALWASGSGEESSSTHRAAPATHAQVNR
ncbi:hypothetical protein [Streptomyces mangrovisoli]|uniref:hypothetical protein n=1 Tax=Streptomyces mangrovisoli TaxID=1428628 RepID=UPI000A4CD2B9|nr:hypothetical protein [Streptomyces mangrovisoli]